MSALKVSVIIPFYNAEKFINGCIECLKNQTLSEIEIIFVNDGSTDNGTLLIDEAAKISKNIFLFNKKNSGQGESRNLGLERARGEFVYFLDVDDFIAFDALEKAYNDAISYNVDIVFFNSVNIIESVEYCNRIENLSQNQILGGHYVKRSVFPLKVITGQQFVIDTLNSEEGFFVVIWLGLYRRSTIQKNRITFVATSYEDNIFSMEIALAAKTIVYRSEILHFRRLVSTSFIHERKIEKHVKGAIHVMQHATNLVRLKYLSQEVRKALEIWDLICTGNVYHNIKLSDDKIRYKYKWKYIYSVLRNMKLYKMKLFFIAIVKL
jgi:glycosyltransferase involved in cell wall biosynthesis